MSKKSKIVLLVLCVFVLTISATCVSLIALRSDPKCVAHRGLSDTQPDNTEASFLAATEAGFYGIETDIRKTADGRYVCHHDETVKYADGTELAIKTSDFSALTARPIRNEKTEKDAYLCSFERYLDICKQGGQVAVIEFKEDFSEAEIQEILSIVDGHYDRAHVSMISFYYEALLCVRKADESVSLQYLSETKKDPVFERCLLDGVSIDVREPLVTPSLVRAFHQKGLTVNTWTVNKKRDLFFLRILRVDYITTNSISEY